MRVTAWRLFKAKHESGAFTGEGARRFGGRWNSKGAAVIYTAQSPSLAALEMLVHLEHQQLMLSYRLCPVSFDEALVERIDPADLPDDWRSSPPPVSLQTIGDQWVQAQRSAVLEVPSAVIEQERNFLLNPQHADFGRIQIGQSMPFQFDPRLAK